MSGAIEVSGLTVVRGGSAVIQDLSVSVPTGSITGLLGPSGCGKTTLMRAIVGTQIVKSGSVTVLGEPAGARSLRGRIGYVTQAPSVYGDLTVRANVAYFAALNRARVNPGAVLETVGLTPFAGRRADGLSGGQKARASLACALVNDPELLVLDEPTVGLDPVLRSELWAEFRELANRGRTLLVSSHVMDEADHCDTLLLMREGRLLAQLTPEELRSRTGETNLEKAFLALIREAENQ